MLNQFWVLHPRLLLSWCYFTGQELLSAGLFLLFTSALVASHFIHYSRAHHILPQSFLLVPAPVVSSRVFVLVLLLLHFASDGQYSDSLLSPHRTTFRSVNSGPVFCQLPFPVTRELYVL